MDRIDQLNRRLGEGLGLVKGGSMPRFRWVFSPDSVYYMKSETSYDFERKCWADRIGKVWMLAQWRMPTWFNPKTNEAKVITEQEWWNRFHGMMPYPNNGEYHPHPETALPPGSLPTLDITQNYIWALDQQQSRGFFGHLDDVNVDLALEKARFRREVWVPMVQNDAPAFNNWDSGRRGGHVSFGGLG